MTALRLYVILALVFSLTATAFTAPTPHQSRVIASRQHGFSATPFFMSKDNDGVVELADDDVKTEEEKAPEEQKAVAPFLSQGVISEEPVDLSDPKSARVMIYIILSLIPVVFLVPLMLGSREMIPADMLPPVEINF
jgi:hypothetical protein